MHKKIEQAVKMLAECGVPLENLAACIEVGLEGVEALTTTLPETAYLSILEVAAACRSQA